MKLIGAQTTSVYIRAGYFRNVIIILEMEPHKQDGTPDVPAQPPPTDEQRAEQALGYQRYGEDKMNNFSFHEAATYMTYAAEQYISIAKTSKNTALVSQITAKLGPLLDRVSLRERIKK